MLAEYFKKKARKYNQFSKSGKTDYNKSCNTCVRRVFSYPYTCDDGWPCGDSSWKDKGNKCINWTNDSKCKVD